MIFLLLAALAAIPAAPSRCVVQQVHTPAGKMVHNAPVRRCDRQEAREERRDPKKG